MRNKQIRLNIILMVIFGSLMLLLMNSCGLDEDRGPKAPESKRMELDSTSMYLDQNYKVYTLEGCEYIVVGYSQLRWGSHKGNCKNPIHYNIGVCETGIDTLKNINDEKK
jgi:hypothetical protein